MRPRLRLTLLWSLSTVLGRTLRLPQRWNQTRIILRPRRNLHHRDPHLCRKKLLMVRPSMRMPAPPAPVLDHQIHLLDSLAPHDRIILPKRRHRHILLKNSGRPEQLRSQAPITILLPPIRDITNRPQGRLPARRLLQHLQPNMRRPIPIIHRRCPILRPLPIQHVPLHIKVRLTRLRILRILLRVSKSLVKQNKLPRRSRNTHRHEPRQEKSRDHPVEIKAQTSAVKTIARAECRPACRTSQTGRASVPRAPIRRWASNPSVTPLATATTSASIGLMAANITNRSFGTCGTTNGLSSRPSPIYPISLNGVFATNNIIVRLQR
jgi:hypothetical protein